MRKYGKRLGIRVSRPCTEDQARFGEVGAQPQCFLDNVSAPAFVSCHFLVSVVRLIRCPCPASAAPTTRWCSTRRRFSSTCRSALAHGMTRASGAWSCALACGFEAVGKLGLHQPPPLRDQLGGRDGRDGRDGTVVRHDGAVSTDRDASRGWFC